MATENPLQLDGRQRKHLRGLAHSLEPIVLVGQAGITDAVATQVDLALTVHELIKVRMREPDDKKAMADDLAVRTGAVLCGLVGHTMILYRQNPEEPRIVVPSAADGFTRKVENGAV